MKSIFECVTEADLVNYIQRCCKHQKSIKAEEAKAIALAAVRYYKGDQSTRALLTSGNELETRWYRSLAINKPDYSVYGHDFFVSDIWACWVVYSRKYLLALKSDKSLPTGFSIIEGLKSNIRSVVDLGCGFGYTTAGLKELFPTASVYGTNLKDTLQFKVATEIGKERNFRMYPDIQSIDKTTDLVFASEYFEHFERPVEHLIEVIRAGKPKAIILANSFGSRSIGHFNTYRYGNQRIENKVIGRVFNRTLRDNGFRSVKTKLWNNRPSVWIK